MSCSSAGSAPEWDQDGGSLALKVHLVTSKGQPLVEAGCAGPPFTRGTLDRPFAGDTDGAYHSLLLTAQLPGDLFIFVFADTELYQQECLIFSLLCGCLASGTMA